MPPLTTSEGGETVLDYIPITQKSKNLWSYIWTLRDKKSFWFMLNEFSIGKAKEYIEKNKDDTDMYIAVSLFKEGGDRNTRGKAADSIGIYGLWLDIDVQCLHRSRADLPRTTADAAKILADGPKPSLIINSGYGLQAWWLFEEPFIFESSGDRLFASKLAGAWNEWYRLKALNFGWGLDSVSDLARIMRIPGTFNHKGDLPVPVEVVEDNKCTYTPSQLSELIPQEAWDARRGTSDPSISVNIVINPDADYPPQFSSMCANIENFAATWTHKKPIKDRSNSGYDLAIASYAAMANLSDQEICDLLICHAKEQGFPIKRLEYYQRTIAKAREGGQLGLAPEETHDVSSIIPKLKDLNASGQDTVYAERKSVFALLSILFGLQIYDFIAYKTDPREYELFTENGKVFFHKGQEDLATSNAFRKRVGDITKVYPPRYKTEDWDVILQALRFAARDVDIGQELSEESQTKMWVESYLASHPPLPEDNIEEAVIARKPFYRNDSVCFYIDELRSWLMSRGERIPLQKLGARLRRIGIKNTKINYRTHIGTRAQTRVFEMPAEDIKIEAEGGEEDGDYEDYE